MSIINTAKMTARQFLQMGEDPPGLRLELVDGEVAVSPSAMPGHSFAEKMLSFILIQHIRGKNLGQVFGDVDTILDDYNVRRPDIIYFSADRLRFVGAKAMEGPPDLCVEILSPSSITIDKRDKFRQYAEAKVANYWIVDPARKSIEGFKLSRGSYRSSGSGKNNEVISLPPFPDLSISLSELWLPNQ